MIARIAAQYALDVDLVHALIKAESAYNVHAVSPVGAVGLMQVMPTTAADYGVTSTTALFDPSTNLRTGMRHLKRLIKKYGNIGHAVMAYNAGEGALEHQQGFVSYPETQRYTHSVLFSYLQKKGIQPYSSQGNEIIGMTLTPAMASAASSKRSRKSRAGTEGLNIDAQESIPREKPRATRLISRLAPKLSRNTEIPDSLSEFRTQGGPPVRQLIKPRVLGTVSR